MNNSEDEQDGSTVLKQRSEHSKEPSPVHDENSCASDEHDVANSSLDRQDGIHISHEDLSDVSDLDSAVASPAVNDEDNASNKENDGPDEEITDLRQKINEKKKALEGKSNDNKSNKHSPSIVDELNDINKKHKNDEDALDFEAEDGECAEEREEKAEEAKPDGKR